ncbi:MAG: hypothetical protein JHC20_02195, partial [Pyrobaculum sp.]|nr:hypothetical protein [Pyrobaculum sp.]
MVMGEETGKEVVEEAGEKATEALRLSSAQQLAAQEDAPQVRKAGEEAAGKEVVEEVEAEVRVLAAGLGQG